MTRPADETGHPHASFIHRTFAPFHSPIPTPAVRTVITEVHNDCVCGKLQPVERRQYPAHVPVDVLAHCKRCPCHRNTLARVIAAQRWIEVRELLIESIG